MTDESLEELLPRCRESLARKGYLLLRKPPHVGELPEDAERYVADGFREVCERLELAVDELPDGALIAHPREASQPERSMAERRGMAHLN